MPTTLITGANRGIGLALATLCAARGDRVIAACRRSSAALDALGVRVEAGVDVADAASLDALARRLDGVAVDRLLLNAGVLGSEPLAGLDAAAYDRMRHQFEVNALGPLRVAHALLPRLAAGAKIAIVTSRMGSIADNGSGGYYGYRASKAAVNAIGKSLAEDLRPRGIAVFLLHPGYVRTDMTGNAGDITPEQSAANLLARVDTLGIAETGSFYHANGTPLPW
jgi:NAD(P)-dependent dehydrogenase (short-subunit alcohol dehydrogenase family)